MKKQLILSAYNEMSINCALSQDKIVLKFISENLLYGV